MLRVEAVRQGRRRWSARRRRARTRRVPRPSSGRRTSPRGFRRRRAACQAPQRARRRIQGRARREPTPRRGRAEACGDRPLQDSRASLDSEYRQSSLGPNLIEEAEATLEEASGASGPPRSRRSRTRTVTALARPGTSVDTPRSGRPVPRCSRRWEPARLPALRGRAPAPSSMARRRCVRTSSVGGSISYRTMILAIICPTAPASGRLPQHPHEHRPERPVLPVVECGTSPAPCRPCENYAVPFSHRGKPSMGGRLHRGTLEPGPTPFRRSCGGDRDRSCRDHPR
jgi:hypothetical protein